MRKKKTVHYLLVTLGVIFCVLVFLAVTDAVAHAAGLVDNTVSNANAYSKYPLENYQLDFYVDSSWDWLPWNWLDGIGKSIQYGLYAITNFVWTVSLYISNATGYVVQEAYKLDFISDTAASIGKNIQTLAGVTSSGFSSEGFYVGFLLILILVMGIYVAYTGLIKRETTKAVHAVINFLVVFILSASFIAYAPNYISKINDFSADISGSALSIGTKIVLPDSNSKGKDSVDLIRDSLFSIQVKQPWLLLQYGESDVEKLGSDRTKSLLAASPDTDDREKIVVDEIENRDNANLSVTKTMSRLGTVVFLFIFNIGISIFVFLLTGMMIFSQVLFIIYAMFLPISFILSMIPTYEGMAKKALTKLFNTIMLRAGITLVITIAFSVSTMFYSISAGYPFFMVAFLQIVTFAGIYMKMGDLMSMFSLQANDTQQVGRRIMRRPYMFLNRGARRLERKIGRTVAVGNAGGVAGTKGASNRQKADTTKMGNHSRPSHDTQTADASSPEKCASAKTGVASDNKGPVRDKARSRKQRAEDTPIQTRYALRSGVSRTQESVSGFKDSVLEEKANRKQGSLDRRIRHRRTIAEKRMELDRAKQNAGSVMKTDTAKERTPVQGRPVTTAVSAKMASKQQSTVRKRPIAAPGGQSRSVKTEVSGFKQQEQVRTQDAEQASPVEMKRLTKAMAAETVTRQVLQRQKQTKTVRQKNAAKSIVDKSANRKGRRK
ncbi:MAG: YtxH domain-containing protein [Firmicutes bacterium]|jgi:hypothetical protein|nr:YtxH domain-containing protein [Bacillota bacterium]